MSSTSMMRVWMSAIGRDPTYRPTAPAPPDHRRHQACLRADAFSPEPPRLLPQVLQLAELALYLLVHVERLLALPDPPLVPRHHELAHLLGQPAVDARGPLRLLREEAVVFGVHIEGLVATGLLAV